MDLNMLLQPLLKWAGGKRQLLGELVRHLPSHYDRYCEPFFGGGALMFELTPACALINDINQDLINFYIQLKKHPDKLLQILNSFEVSKEAYLEIRNADRDVENFAKLSPIYKAARTFYLNRYCFNGLYRVNKKGFFNVPFNNAKKQYDLPIDLYYGISNYLNEHDITITSQNYLKLEKEFKEGDFVYFDPPYDLVEKYSFTDYSNSSFKTQEQIELKQLCDRLSEKNIKFMLSNSATDFIKELYKDYNVNIVSATRIINSKVSGRGAVEEVIVTNY